ncbi:MAG: CPBP family intramembrane metalloprotease [Coriobacteriales bacterium]|nr:CPBP family intramembrane metalloprotease [Coriobacteriales bacterium]
MILFRNKYHEIRSGWAVAAGIIVVMLDALIVNSLHNPWVDLFGFQILSIACLIGLFWLLYRRPPRLLGFSANRWGRQLLLGGALGTGAMLLIALVLFGLGCGFAPLDGELPVVAIALCLVAALLTGCAEELFARGYLMTVLKTSRNRYLIVLLPALLFAVLHLDNANISALPLANLFLFALLAAFLFVRTGSLCAAIGFHGMWNFVQGNILGIPVSGSPESARVFDYTASGAAWLTGGDFGAESSIVATVVLLAAFLLVYLLTQKSEPVWSLASDLPLNRQKAGAPQTGLQADGQGQKQAPAQQSGPDTQTDAQTDGGAAVSQSESERQKNLFRKKALSRLSSADQLDQEIQIVSPLGWLSLIAIICLAIAILAWSFFGRISDKVTGTGILAYGDSGIVGVYSRGDGQINSISVTEGEHVSQGDVIANVTLYDILDEISLLEGVAGREELLEARQQELEANSALRAPVSGIILDINYTSYSYIEKGSLLCRIIEDTTAAGDIFAVLYVPLAQGQSIEPGMSVDVSPKNLNREESGYLVGTVMTVSQYAVSTKSMMTELNSQPLVDSMSKLGAMMEVRVKLARDEAAPSGYKWSRSNTAPDEVAVETLCDGDIYIADYRPITIILPFMKPLLP